MKRLTKYLLPYLGIIIATVALLFAQANCDLALPDYMSRIVNIGIQQGGIEDAAAASEYRALGLDAASIQRDYLLKTGGAMLVIALLSALAAVAVGYLSSRLSAGLARDLRSAVLRQGRGLLPGRVR